ncbi:sensor histidine kinase [Streptosporangium sp. NBC_01469]|uniref:sensor histidine kinase n=1 Tax=Streptosporangium sp. NBC_01469 TaxID=2903898 RepID=UPI002E2CF552|nr:histidine kinase [Streptosporangium sp. NBC_01469]
MRNGVILAVIAESALISGLHLDSIPLWRQLLFVILAVAAYLHGRHLPVRRGWLLLTVLAMPGVVYAVPDFATGAGALTALGLFVVLPWLAGRFQRQQADLLEAGRERVARLRREREFIAERVTLRERARIAEDMHDSLGHELALIALRAGALELAADMTRRNREAAAQLRASAVTATDRLRHTLGVLRESGAVSTEPPDESIEALVDRACGAGMTVVLHRAGERAPLPPLVDRAAHRVVRESLTNAARHAPDADVLVRVERTRDTVTVTVSNSAVRAMPGPGLGPGPEPRPGLGSGGSGIAGLRERVRLLGGTLQAGPHDGGFTVTARFPLDQERGPLDREGFPPDREGFSPGRRGDEESR